MLAYGELAVRGGVESCVPVTTTSTACRDDRRFQSSRLLEAQRSWTCRGSAAAGVGTRRRLVQSGLNSLHNTAAAKTVKCAHILHTIEMDDYAHGKGEDSLPKPTTLKNSQNVYRRFANHKYDSTSQTSVLPISYSTINI